MVKESSFGSRETDSFMNSRNWVFLFVISTKITMVYPVLKNVDCFCEGYHEKRNEKKKDSNQTKDKKVPLCAERGAQVVQIKHPNKEAIRKEYSNTSI